MKPWFVRTAATLAAVFVGAVRAEAQQARITYPVTRTVDTVTTYHGTAVPDPYRWLESLDSPDVVSWVKSENAVTMPYLAALPGRTAINGRLTALYNYPRTSVPFWEGGHWFYTRNSGLQRQNVWYMRPTLTGTERLLVDPNKLSPDGSVAFSSFDPSPDGRWYVYGLSQGGSDWSTLYVRDIAGGQNTADTVRWVKFSGISWTRDGRGFFYSRFPEPATGKALEAKLEHQTLYYHRLGTGQSADLLIYARPDNPTWFVTGGLDETGRYLFITTSRGTDKNELYLADLRDPLHPSLGAPVRPIVTGHDANYSALGVVRGQLYLLMDRGAPNRKIVVAPVATPDSTHWRTLVPESAEPIEGASLVAGRLGVLQLQDVASVLTLYDLDGKPAGQVQLPGLGTASGVLGRFDRPEMFYVFTSPLQPTTTYVYDAASKSSRAFDAPHLTFDPAAFSTERVFYQSKDGTRVPMFITARKDVVKNGTNPTLLYAYGGFDISMHPTFQPSVIAWIERGGVYAVANIRGGGEYGEAWHQAGQFGRKQNVFDDFISAAEYLIREKYTSTAHLAINGGSNGGLLVGAAMTQRPELFAAAVPQVGVMDMLRYDHFTGGAAWATEYGSSSDSAAFTYLRTYSPLQNIRSGVCYPATLVTTADHDDRVVPSHSFKFTATMQAAQAAAACDKPVLIRIEAEGSHGYRPLDRRIAEIADILSFAAYHTGMQVTARPVP